MTDHSYGRGKFPAHENYVKYMSEVVQHPNYAGMPNAVSSAGRINWQVSSGKSTSFYKDYLARKVWWEEKSADLGLYENGDKTGVFTVAARLLSPTGYRPCRLCGSEMNVGYFYVNHTFSKTLERDFIGLSLPKFIAISDVIAAVQNSKYSEVYEKAFLQYFPERRDVFSEFGVTITAFQKSNYIRTTKLSPGFMGNPPDRLDGFHDYCLNCRKDNDPGRQDENMRSYSRDRRAFVWWAEGNWALADQLYNSAGPGKCEFDGCSEQLEKVSPDHVGPLACGFKQLPVFIPSCQRHNSAKNRRFTYSDVKKLMEYELTSGDSVASWQVRAHWDAHKDLICSDKEAIALSNSMRSIQDMYLRVLYDLILVKKYRFLATILSPEYAMYDYHFRDLDTARLTFSSYTDKKNTSDIRLQQRCRVIRIGFDSLNEYIEKGIDKRNMVRSDYADNADIIRTAIQEIAFLTGDLDEAWVDAFEGNVANESKIGQLLVNDRAPSEDYDPVVVGILQRLFNQIGSAALVDFERYGIDRTD